MPGRKSKQSDPADRNASAKQAAGPSAATASVAEDDELKAEQDELLTEALKESFPASDPISSLRFTLP
ncbi:hypothetical protein [Methyloferula stellata]|uniref:hypothetical protein n=1 Tax=Methyloferula stellata TaxID=876270 RepID=UPI00035EE1BD|nr:hypothetical protein [Methyloferula stellata]